MIVATPLPPPVRAAIVVRMSASRYPSANACIRLARTRVGVVSTCWGARESRLQLRTTDGRLIRFGLIGDYAAWVSVSLSPNGRWLLLQADLACDSRGAFVVRVTGGTPRTVPRPGQGCDGSGGWAYGWTRTSRSIVGFEPSQCTCRMPEGYYSVDPSTRFGLLLWRGQVNP